MRTLAVVLFALVVAAPAAAQQKPGPGHVPDPAVVDGSAQKALDRAKAAWRAKGAATYTQEVRLSCFCRPTGYRKVRVRGGKLSPVPTDVEAVATVPRQFKVIQEAIDANASALTVRYGSRGNPLQISIDRDNLIADEESYYTMRRFRLG